MKTGKLTNEQVCSFCMALEHLIHAGIGLGDALVLLEADEQDPALRRMLGQMAHSADEGASASEVIRQSGSFPAYVTVLMEVGEHLGKTEQTLGALARYYEGRERLDRQMRSALVYPAMLMLVLLAVAVILLVWVLPVFNDVYAQLGSSLTGLAGGLLALGRALRRIMPVLCAVLALLTAVLAIAPLRRQAFRLFSRLLGDRGVGKDVLSARFVQALAMAADSGMTEREAAVLAAKLSEGESAAFEKRCAACLSELENGKSLSQALGAGEFLKGADCRLLDAGRRSGKQETVLGQIAQRLLEQSEEKLHSLLGRIEPALVAAACLLIGIVLLSVMLPLMDIMTAIG